MFSDHLSFFLKKMPYTYMQTLHKNQIYKHYNVSMLFDKRITFPVIPFFVLLGHWNGKVKEKKNRTFRENRKIALSGKIETQGETS